MLRVVTRLARARQVRSQEGGGQAGLSWQIKCTQLQFLGSARTASSVVVVPAPTGPMEFHKSTRDLKGAQEKNTPMRCETAVAILASEVLALVYVSRQQAPALLETSARPSDARPASATSRFSGVLLCCALCLHISRTFAEPNGVRRRRAVVTILASEGLAQIAVSCQHARRSFVPQCHAPV